MAGIDLNLNLEPPADDFELPDPIDWDDIQEWDGPAHELDYNSTTLCGMMGVKQMEMDRGMLMVEETLTLKMPRELEMEEFMQIQGEENFGVAGCSPH
ncbi:unnamed protein product [Urochloa humidicola]